VRLSKSKVNTYTNCPRQFRFEYIEKLKDYDDEPVEGTPLRIGLDVHDIYEWYYKHADSPYITGEDDMRKILAENPMSSKYQNYIDSFVEWNMEMFNEFGQRYMPDATEMYIHDQEEDFNGFIDVVFDSPEGKIIVDYKTGKQKSIREYAIELLLYKYIYERKTGNSVAHVGIFFPKEGNKWRMAKILLPGEEPPKKGAYFTLEDEFVAIDTMRSIRERIDDGDFPPNESFLCDWCDYRNMCQLEGYE
jgi:putative RecB family exonuclease